ncbi:methyltransferase domain-containing protein [Peredibacter starrii]|uniref:Methyltransferase domain-containing protein n=1 Tax=Peredibacter starrii TaxID=28202 RepID=A0AAX4HUD6_9BACT|nr:methyltransferase domain-containing protein [Peredibacter starrii]WPU66564.1 methyltransferase domain-containing protein [Peredibacter starrii]
MSKDSWAPNQYEKFKDQRSEPFYDLMSLLNKVDSPSIVDLGCGTGELTAELHKKMNAKQTFGIDSSEKMLEKARAFQTDYLKFELGNIASWNPGKQFDIIFSNAALQWCGDHPALFQNISKNISQGGQLAVQMPMNHDYPTHTIADELSRELGYESREHPLLLVEDYASLLFKLGFKEQKVQLRVYGHILNSREEVIEWVKGSMLTYYQSRLKEDQFKNFMTEYRERLFKVLPDDKPYFYPFKRIFIWGRK